MKIKKILNIAAVVNDAGINVTSYRLYKDRFVRIYQTQSDIILGTVFVFLFFVILILENASLSVSLFCFFLYFAYKTEQKAQKEVKKAYKSFKKTLKAEFHEIDLKTNLNILNKAANKTLKEMDGLTDKQIKNKFIQNFNFEVKKDEIEQTFEELKLEELKKLNEGE
jgi:valyl-tRNA synthetase